MAIENRKKYLVCLLLLVLSMFFSACAKNEVLDSEITVSIDEETVEAPIDQMKDQKPLVLVTDHYPPYVDAFGDEKGFCYDLVTEIFSRRGIEVVVEYYPWTRGIELVKSHYAFAAFPWVKNSQRLREFDFSNNLYSEEISVVYLDDNLKVKEQYIDKEDLKRYNVGTVSGYFYIQELEALDFNLDISNTEEEAITKLYNGRTDVVILGKKAIKNIIDKLYQDESAKFAFMDRPYRIIYDALRVSKDYPNKAYYLSEFNLGFREVIEDGTYAKLIDQYKIEDIDENRILDQYNREKIIIGLEDYAPYEYLNAEGEIAGIGYEMILEALCRMGYGASNYEFVVYPWSRLMELGKNGDVDVILDAFYTEERSQQFDFSEEEYLTVDYYFIALEHNAISFDGHLFSKPVETIGIIRDYQYGDAILEKLKDFQAIIDEVGTTDELMEGLLNGRYDVIVEGEIFSKFYMKEHNRHEQLSYLWKPLDSISSYIMYAKDRNEEAFIQEVDKKIREIRRDGTFKKIIKFYLE